jgi:hypothetical protein
MEGSGDHTHAPAERFIGKRPWDFPFVNLTEAHWEAHKLTLNERRSFRDLELVGRENDGQLFYILVSGEPVFDSKGRFCGYRGTSRDVTAARRSDQKARRLSGLYAMLSGRTPSSTQPDPVSGHLPAGHRPRAVRLLPITALDYTG